MLKGLRVARWLLYKKSIPVIYIDGVRSARDLCDLVDKELNPYFKHNDPRFVGLLERARRLYTNEPRDVVYGMIGLLQWQRQGPDADLSPLVIPDYQRPVADVLRDATIYAIEESQALWVFRDISHWSNQELENRDLPSWAVDWNRHWDENEDTVEFIESPTARRKPYQDGPFSMSTQEGDRDVIILEGFQLGQVITTSRALTWDILNSDQMLNEWLIDLMNTVSNDSTDTLVKPTIATTLLAGVNYVNEHEWTHHCAIQDYLSTLDTQRRSSRPGDGTATQSQAVGVAQIQHALRYAVCRSVVLTEFADIGLGPKLTREGDILVMLNGGVDPFILRPYGEGFRLLGECYVHGISMDGAEELYRLEGIKKSLFWLR